MTQEELNAQLAALAEELRGMGVPISREISPQVEVNSRAQRRLGCCIQKEGAFTIRCPSGRWASRNCCEIPFSTSCSTPVTAAKTTENGGKPMPRRWGRLWAWISGGRRRWRNLGSPCGGRK